MPKDIKAPTQFESDTNRKGTETPARVYTDLLSGKVCSDNFQPLPNDAVEDPGVKIITKRLSNTSKIPAIIGTN